MMLDDKTKPVDKLELNQFKNSNPKAWPSARVHDLFLWSKSMSQFRSVLMNMSHMEWLRVKDSIANGQFAPKKAASVIPTQIIPAGELGFHGCTLASAIKIQQKIKRQPQVGYLPDWKAFYVGSGPDHALGYIEPPSDFKAKASGVILSISCRSPLKRIFISNAALNPSLTSSAKASKIKEWLEIDAAKPLMDELGKRSAFIEMTDSEGNFERIIPWSIAELHCTAKDSGIPITYDSMSGKFSLGL